MDLHRCRDSTFFIFTSSAAVAKNCFKGSSLGVNWYDPKLTCRKLETDVQINSSTSDLSNPRFSCRPVSLAFV